MNTITFLAIGVFALVLMWFAWRTRDRLLCTASALTWFALGFLGFFSPEATFDIGTQLYSRILVYVVFGFLVGRSLLWMMDADIRYEAKGRKGETVAWTRSGPPPESKRETDADRRAAYRKDLRRRIG